MSTSCSHCPNDSEAEVKATPCVRVYDRECAALRAPFTNVEELAAAQNARANVLLPAPLSPMSAIVALNAKLFVFFRIICSVVSVACVAALSDVEASCAAHISAGTCSDARK